MSYKLSIENKTYPVEDIHFLRESTLAQEPVGKPFSFISPVHLPFGQSCVLHGNSGGYPYAPGYYYAQQPVYYAPQTVVYSDQPQVVYSSPTVNYEPQRPAQPSAPAPSVQQQPVQSNPQKPSMTLVEIKALAKAGLSDAVILSQIHNNQVVFHLTTAEIIDLKTSEVSEKVIDFMINTASRR